MRLHHCVIARLWRVRHVTAVLMLWAAFAADARCDTLLIHPRAESASDSRYQYDWAVLRMAMDKTQASFGPYEIREAAEKMVPSRVEYEMQSTDGRLNIFVRSTSIDLEKNFLPVRIPVDRGLLGYRVLLVRSADLPAFAAVRNLDDLRKFRIGQGKAWSDVKILRMSGFSVVEGDSYDGLFSMLTADASTRFPVASAKPWPSTIHSVSRIPKLPSNQPCCCIIHYHAISFCVAMPKESNWPSA